MEEAHGKSGCVAFFSFFEISLSVIRCTSSKQQESSGFQAVNDTAD